MSALHNIELLQAKPKAQVLLCESMADFECAQKQLDVDPVKGQVIPVTWLGGRGGLNNADFSPLKGRGVVLLTPVGTTEHLKRALRSVDVSYLKVIKGTSDDWNIASAPDDFNLLEYAKQNKNTEVIWPPRKAANDYAPSEPASPADALQQVALAPAPSPAPVLALPPPPTRHIGGRTNDIDFVGLMEPVARQLLGEPNAKLSSPTELRFGAKGSLSVHLGKGGWHDHETGAGGGLLDLIVHKGDARDHADAARWLKHQSLTSQPVAPVATRKSDDAANKLRRAQTTFADCDAATLENLYVARKQGREKGFSIEGLRTVSFPMTGWAHCSGRPMIGWLAVPAYAEIGNAGEVMAVQFIGPGKNEKLNSATPIKGHMFTVGTFAPGETTYVVEGIGHAWSLNAVTGRAAVVSFSAGHIEVVAAKVKAAGGIPVIVPDRGKEADAERIAARLECSYAPLPADLADKADVNDLHLDRGAEAVEACVEAAVVPTGPCVSTVPVEARALKVEQFKTGDQTSIHDVHQMDRVNEMSWPNMDLRPGATRPLNTIPNLNHLLRNYGFTVRYDVIRKELKVTHPGQRGTRDNVKSKTIDTVLSLAALNFLPKTEIPSFMLSIGDENPVNPVMDFISAKPWDGILRLGELLRSIETKVGFQRDLLELLLRRWLISAVAAAAKPEGFWSKGVLVFQGDQSLGKTAWFRALLPMAMRDLVKVDAHIDPKEKDTIISAVSHWLVELGELDGTMNKADTARLKGFISQDVDQFRRPYGRAEEKFQRRTVFFASVNPRQFLVDETGNVRWWTVPVISVNSDHGIDMQQMWAEACTWFEAGERWWLDSDEEARLNSANVDHEQSNPIDDLIGCKYNFQDSTRRRLSATQVLLELGYSNPTKKLLNEAATVMRKQFGESTKSDGRRVFRVPHLIAFNHGY